MGEHATALLLHHDCGRHDPGWGHPEHQGRLPAIVSALEKATPELLGKVLQVEAVPVSPDVLEACHASAMIDRVRTAVARAADAGTPVALAEDTYVSSASWDAALAAVGCAVAGVDLVLDGTVPTAFALCRPPGHHATPIRSMGFCLFNAIALAARHARGRGVERVLIVDWDVHHGNGTQDIFWEDPDVFYVSLHQWPWYPGTGGSDERGEGPGRGTTQNRPLPAGTTGPEYQAAFSDAVRSAAAAHAPDRLLVSAGFDTLAGDPLGGFRLEPADMHALVVAARDIVGGDVGVVACLEGGYDPPRTAAGVVEVFRALAFA
jgi:acetoin utilization deacetylase AcuC-like enzyme